MGTELSFVSIFVCCKITPKFLILYHILIFMPTPLLVSLPKKTFIFIGLSFEINHTIYLSCHRSFFFLTSPIFYTSYNSLKKYSQTDYFAIILPIFMLLGQKWHVKCVPIALNSCQICPFNLCLNVKSVPIHAKIIRSSGFIGTKMTSETYVTFVPIGVALHSLLQEKMESLPLYVFLQHFVAFHF